jgi:hypothetical protein
VFLAIFSIASLNQASFCNLLKPLQPAFSNNSLYLVYSQSLPLPATSFNSLAKSWKSDLSIHIKLLALSLCCEASLAK